MKPHILWGFIWIQIVCKGHQRSSKFTASRLRANTHGTAWYKKMSVKLQDYVHSCFQVSCHIGSQALSSTEFNYTIKGINLLLNEKYMNHIRIWWIPLNSTKDLNMAIHGQVYSAREKGA